MAGILLTGGIQPHKSILELMAQTHLPVILLKEDSYTVAAAVHKLKVKIQPSDTRKIEMAPRLVREHVNIDRIVELL